MRDVRIFRLSNSQNAELGYQERIIITAYSRSGLTVSAWNGYSDKIIGRASGGGYDKTHTALASAIAWIVKERSGVVVPLGYNEGAAGFEAVARAVEALGLGWKVEKVI